MSDEVKGLSVVVAGVATVATILILSISYYNVTTTQAAIKAGMQETYLPVSARVVWAYPDRDIDAE